jgi:hypothetical protein
MLTIALDNEQRKIAANTIAEELPPTIALSLRAAEIELGQKLAASDTDGATKLALWAIGYVECATDLAEDQYETSPYFHAINIFGEFTKRVNTASTPVEVYEALVWVNACLNRKSEG